MRGRGKFFRKGVQVSKRGARACDLVSERAHVTMWYRVVGGENGVLETRRIGKMSLLCPIQRGGNLFLHQPRYKIILAARGGMGDKTGQVRDLPFINARSIHHHKSHDKEMWRYNMIIDWERLKQRPIWQSNICK